MSEIRKEAKVYQVDYRCDACGDGFMRPTGFTFAMNPYLYQHECNKCGKEGRSHVTYPTITYETEDSPTEATPR